jgi:hypothetical protein
MKKSLGFLFTMFLAATGAQAQDNSGIVQDSIIFKTTIYDYGTIAQGADGNCEFTFTNKGKSPLVLSNVQASCGCTTPEWPKEPISPGKTGVIKVTYNTNNTGPFRKSITVNSSAANSSVVLIITGSVTPKQ